jgi:hypothetical protein
LKALRATIRNGPVSPAGLLVTLMMAVFVTLAAVWWWQQMSGGGTSSLGRLHRNELLAFESLREIMSAQEEYYQESAGIFGDHRYAAFVTHLWIAVDPEGKQVAMDLIPRRLAVAVGETKASSGYYFVDVRERVAFPDRDVHTTDYGRQWVVAGLPEAAGRTGTLIFMADQTGTVFAHPAATFSSIYPMDPAENGWMPLADRDALRAYQEKLRQP